MNLKMRPCRNCTVEGDDEKVKVIYRPRGMMAIDFRVKWEDGEPHVSKVSRARFEAAEYRSGHRPSYSEKIASHMRREAEWHARRVHHGISSLPLNI